MWFRFLLAVTFLFAFPSLQVVSQTKLTYRTQYDDSVFSPVRQIYPFKIQKRPRVGVVLSGGGARGTAQIGVLKALEENNIPIDFISATSIGSIIGGLYASGYTTAEIESLALATNWDELLSLSDEAKRIDLAIDQKLADDWSFLLVRFQGLQPVLPHAVSNGQRLTNFLSEKTLQGIYHPDPNFNYLRIPFRAVTTDLISGRRVVLDHGSLAEALRASSTVPLLFIPIERDSMQLVDGGLMTNIPVDVAKNAGCSIVVAVNTTSGLRHLDEMSVPWETADQIMGIMMQLSNQEQLHKADVTITPAVGRHLSSDFTSLDSLMSKGYTSTVQQVDSIKFLYAQALRDIDYHAAGDTSLEFSNVSVEFSGEGIPDSIVAKIRGDAAAGKLSSGQIQTHVRMMFDCGNLEDAWADVYPQSQPVRIVYNAKPNPRLLHLEFAGNELVSTDSLALEFALPLGRWLNYGQCETALENLLRLYRRGGYSLARITGSSFDPSTGTLRLQINEGVIKKINVRGSERAEDSFVLREFAMKEGEVFEIERAKSGITNINSTKVFEYIFLEVSYEQQKPVLTLRLAELPSQLIRVGMRIDDERRFQGTIDIRDENFRGIGSELGLTLSGGGRNGFANLEFRSNRLFSSSFTLSVGMVASLYNSYLYGDDPGETRVDHWARLRLGEYSDIRWGGTLTVGTQLERLGNATIEWSLQDARIRSVEAAQQLEDHYTLSLIKAGTVIDSRNSTPFPTSGINLKLSYEFATKDFLSGVGYNAIRFMYESYSSWGLRSTFHPRIAFGFSDITMPLGQQFRLGGRESMFGTREDDRRGRQLLALSFEYRYRLPVHFIFDTYIRIRYDLASLSAIPEQIKLSSFRHGIGSEIAFETPVGQAALGVGKSFFFARDLPENPIQQGPLMLYFALGYEL